MQCLVQILSVNYRCLKFVIVFPSFFFLLQCISFDENKKNKLSAEIRTRDSPDCYFYFFFAIYRSFSSSSSPSQMLQRKNTQENRAIARRTARCHCKFRQAYRYISSFTTASCGFSATVTNQIKSNLFAQRTCTVKQNNKEINSEPDSKARTWKPVQIATHNYTKYTKTLVGPTLVQQKRYKG